jgi:DNA-binding transcriptional LysR family regulator
VTSLLDEIVGLRVRPAGRVRLVVSPLAATMVLAPKLGAFAHAYPDVILDVTTTNELRMDLVAGHFDAGIHLGEFIERDMIAVRVSADQRAAIVGTPEYFVRVNDQYRIVFRFAGPDAFDVRCTDDH